MWIKVCGLTRELDVEGAVEAGVDAIGLNLWPRSKRYVPLERARELATLADSSCEVVLLFVDADEETILEAAHVTGVKTVQLHGGESQALTRSLAARGLAVIEARSLGGPEGVGPAIDHPAPRLLLDAGTAELPGGTGARADWPLCAKVARVRPVILAGGLTPDNVDAAIAAVEPSGVDVASGVESVPGVKNLAAMTSFVTRARAAAREHCDTP